MPVFAIPFPAIDPVAIEVGPLAVRWYALAYMAGILVGWWYALKLVRNDALWGGNQNDTLEGGAGQDTLTGGMQDDLLTGNAGNDIFVFVDGDGRDTISDFEALNGSERIDLSGVSAITDFADLQGMMSQSGTDVLIDAGGGDTITLAHVALADLDASDFVF